MSPRKRHHIESLEELSLVVVLSSVVADLHLAHLLSTDLQHSIMLSSLSVRSPDELRKLVAARLSVLPGLLNDQVRDRMVKRLFANPEPDKWVNAKLDILRVILDESIVTIDCGEQALPRRLLQVVGERCPDLTSLKATLHQIEPYAEDHPSEEREGSGITVMSAPPLGRSLFFREILPHPTKDYAEEPPKSSTSKVAKVQLPSPCSVFAALAPLTQLSTLHLMNGANNEILAAVGQSAPRLKEFRMCYSYGVTDEGLKALCLRFPDNHLQRKGRNLHELRVRSFQLNPCCTTLSELDIIGTCITQYGVAFLLKHLPVLRSLGDCTSVTEAIEVLVGNKSLRTSFMNRIRRYASRFKLTRVKEDSVSASKVIVITTHCPDLKDLSLTHRFCEVDLDRLAELPPTPSNFSAHLEQLKSLKHLSLVNVMSRSVSGALQAVGHQLTALTVCCRGLEVSVVFQSCPNLKYLTIEGEDVSAPYEAVDNFRETALFKLQIVRIKCHLPAAYTDVIFDNAKNLSRLEIACLCDTNDDRVNQLVQNKCLEKLREFDVGRAPKLTIASARILVKKCPKLRQLQDLGKFLASARILVKKCPKLRQLQDLGGWNVKSEEYNAFLKETEVENYDIQIVYKPRRVRNDSHSEDDWMDYSDEESGVWGPMRNLFPLVIL